MRSKLVLAGLFTLLTSPVFAQVAPAVKTGSLPLTLGGGLSDFSIDYGPNRRMIAVTAWADYNFFHGAGLEIEGMSIFADKPKPVTRMKQNSIKGGLIYKGPQVGGLRPYAKFLIGIGELYFPDKNPLYVQDNFITYGMGGGVEYKVWKRLSVRGDYEYQYYTKFLGNNSLNPNGFTIGASYSFRGIHRH